MFGEEQSENQEFTALPEGKYNVIFDNATLDESGNYSCITAQFTVADGAFARRKLWKRFYFSEGTSKKFLPWQFSILRIKEELSQKKVNSYEESAREALELMANVFGDAFVVDVSVNDQGYNDLILIQSGHDLSLSEVNETKSIKPQSTKGLPNMAPTFDKDEEISF